MPPRSSVRASTTLTRSSMLRDLGEHVERNFDVETILDLHDEVHDRDGIDVEIGRDVRLPAVSLTALC